MTNPTKQLLAAADPRSLELRKHWLLRPDVVYLNHGSFGPSPLSVLAEQQKWREELQGDPWDFLARKMSGHLALARQRLGQFLGCDGEHLTFVDNATTAMNIVAAGVKLSAGDEVLLTDHEYGAVTRLWQITCDRVGAKVVTAELPYPLSSAEETVAAVMNAVTPRTRLLVFSHVTSPTAVVLPAEELCRRARERGLEVCVDGPHAPVMIPLHLSRLDCDYYTASLHKWLSAPVGSGFLYVHPRRQKQVRPVVVSWGTTPGEQPGNWQDEFIWVGTRDPSAYLSVPAAIDFVESLGLEVFRRRTHALVRYARNEMARLFAGEPLTADEEQWYGSMVAFAVPEGDAPRLQDALWQRYRIETPVAAWKGRRVIRVSAYWYTTSDQVDFFLRALEDLFRETI